ncbi:MAG: hypothetical protein AAF678_03115 [Pseudomonadota bacterium]
MIPYNFFSPTIEFPLSGDVEQAVSPIFGYDFEGIPEIEYEITTKVASPGKQLGKLTEAVLAIARQMEFEGDDLKAIEDLTQLHADIEDAKTSALAKLRARKLQIEKRIAVLEKQDARRT